MWILSSMRSIGGLLISINFLAWVKGYMLKKKWVRMVIVGLIIMSFATSCKYNDAKETDNGIYIYSVWNELLLKYNVKTGVATTVCNDPLCQHNSEDCLFYNANPAICVNDNKIYFCKYESNNTETLYVYDIASGKNRKIKTGLDTDEFWRIESYLYLWNRTYNTNEQKFYMELQRYEIENDKWVTLELVPAEERAYYLNYDDEKIYWYNDMGDEFTTDYNYKNLSSVQIGGRMEGEYIYSLKRNFTTVSNYHEANSRSLYRREIGVEKEEILSEDLDNYVIVNGKIIYITSIADPELVYQSPYDENDKYYDHYNGCVYTMDLAGENKKTLVENAECNIYRLIATPSDNAMINGEYVAFMLYGYLDDGSYGISPNLLIVNSETGEYKITEFIR